MTMPTMMNCPHSGEGWCLECVAKLGHERDTVNSEANRLREQLTNITAVLPRLSDEPSGWCVCGASKDLNGWPPDLDPCDWCCQVAVREIRVLLADGKN